MLGTWYLLNTASKCSYLVNHGTKVEPTVITIARTATSNETLSVSTKTRQWVQLHMWLILLCVLCFLSIFLAAEGANVLNPSFHSYWYYSLPCVQCYLCIFKNRKDEVEQLNPSAFLLTLFWPNWPRSIISHLNGKNVACVVFGEHSMKAFVVVWVLWNLSGLNREKTSFID